MKNCRKQKKGKQDLKSCFLGLPGCNFVKGYLQNTLHRPIHRLWAGQLRNRYILIHFLWIVYVEDSPSRM